MNHVRKERHNAIQHVRYQSSPIASGQEFEFQGHEFRGPAATLFKAGAVGRHQNNIKRDWFRQMGQMDYDHRAPCKFKLKHVIVNVNSPIELYLQLSFHLRYLFAWLVYHSGTLVMKDGMKFKSHCDLKSVVFYTNLYHLSLITYPNLVNCCSLVFWPMLRQMPYILPEDIIPWLTDRKLWPNIPRRKIIRYWNHLRDVKSEIAEMSVTGEHHPLWIWGDAANYCKDQNVIVICFGSVLDDTKDSIKACFPLVLCREDTWIQKNTFLFSHIVRTHKLVK